MNMPKLYFHINVAQVIGTLTLGYVAVKYIDMMTKSRGIAPSDPIADLASYIFGGKR